jgi:hypothetical protein
LLQCARSATQHAEVHFVALRRAIRIERVTLTSKLNGNY